MLRFEWNLGKAQRNSRKHGVAFREAVTVFYDPRAATFEDPDHSVGEQRFVTVGYSAAERLVVVCHAERGSSVRIIGARLATPRERRRHEEGE